MSKIFSFKKSIFVLGVVLSVVFLGASFTKASSTTVELLTGNTYNSWGGSAGPYNTVYMDSRMQSVYLKSDLEAVGMSGSTEITQVCLQAGDIVAGTDIANLRIRMQNSPLTTLSAFTTTGWTTVYGPTSYSKPAASEWVCHTLSPTFNWDGTNNLMVDVYRNDSVWVSSGSVGTRYTEAGRTYSGYCDNCTGCGVGEDCDLPTAKAPQDRVLSMKLVYGEAVPPQAPDIPTLASPTNGESGTIINPELKFNYNDFNLDNATQFDLVVDNNSDFSSPLINETNYSTNGPWTNNSNITYFVEDDVLAGEIKYYWKVRVYDGALWSEWTDGTWNFTTDRFLGYNPSNEFLISNSYGLALSSSAVRNSFRFTAQNTKQATRARVYIAGVIGRSPTYKIGLQADNSGNPSGTYLAYGLLKPTSAGWWDVAFTKSTVLVAGNVYHLVLQYSKGTINTSNNAAEQFTGPNNYMIPYNNASDPNQALLRYSGTAWSILGNYNPVYMIGYSDSTYEGNPYSDINLRPIYTNNYPSQKYIAQNSNIVKTLGFYLRRSSLAIPPDDLYYEIRNGSGTVLRSGVLIDKNSAPYNFIWHDVKLSSPLQLEVGSTYYFELKSPLSNYDDYYEVMASLTADNADDLSYLGVSSTYSALIDSPFSTTDITELDFVFRLAYDDNQAPVVPVISGPTSGEVGSSYGFVFTATDNAPASDSLRYGIDWNMDSVVDEWVPTIGYVLSGTSASTTNVWNTVGAKTFQVLAEDDGGIQSTWAQHTITITGTGGGVTLGTIGGVTGQWGVFLQNIRHTGLNSNSLSNPGFLKWQSSNGGRWAVVGSDGTVYSSAGQYVYALNPNDGTEKWNYYRAYTNFRAPGVITADGNLLVFVNSGSVDEPDNLILLSPVDGTVLSATPISDIRTDEKFASAAPSIDANGNIYVSSYTEAYSSPISNISVRAFNPDLSLKWTKDFPITGGYSDTYGVDSYSDIYYLPSALSPAISSDSNTVYFANLNGKVYALNSSTGATSWIYSTSDNAIAMYSTPSVSSDGTIYATTDGGCLHAINPTGTMKWKKCSHFSYGSVSVGADGTIYAMNDGVTAFNPSDGSTKWESLTGSDGYSSTPVIASDGTIYYHSYDAIKLFAINSDGTLKWVRDSGRGQQCSSPVIADDGTVYAASDGDGIYAFGNINQTPNAPTITGPTTGAAETNYDFGFVATDSFEADSDGTYLANMNDFAASGYHTCSVSEGGNAYCWGAAAYGKLGDGQTTTDRLTPVRVQDGTATGSDTDGTYLTNMANIDTELGHTCAVSNGGSAYCWGAALYGKLGDNQSSTDKSSPVQVQDGAAVWPDSNGTYLANLKAIALGEYHTCAVSNGGNAYCWGYGLAGKLGDGQENADRYTPVRVHDGAAFGTADSDGTYLKNIKSIVAGSFHTCAVSNSGNPYCWGYASHGQIGDGQDTTNRFTPVRVLKGAAVAADTDGTYLTNIKSMNAGEQHTCAVSNSGNVYCWGDAGYGKLGDGQETAVQLSPVRVLAGGATSADTDGLYLTNIANIELGVFHTCAVSEEGNAYCWGCPTFGKLGDGQDIADRLAPVQVKEGEATGTDTDGTYLTNIKSIVTGTWHTCAISNDGNPYCWGNAEYGKLGDNQVLTDRFTPIKIQDGEATTEASEDSIHYGIDWDMNSVVDEWVPVSDPNPNYVPSGTTASTTNQWASDGTKIFQALTEDDGGLRSDWTQHEIVLSPRPESPVITGPTTGVTYTDYEFGFTASIPSLEEVGYIQDTESGGTAEVLDYPDEVYVSGNYAYVASYQDDALSIIDISNPTNPVEVGYIQDDSQGGTAYALNNTMGVSVVGNYAYVASYIDGALSVIDISNPTNPVEVGYIQDDYYGGTAHALSGSEDVYVSGNYAYVSSSAADGFSIIDISNPTNPVEVGYVQDTESGGTAQGLDGANSVYVYGNYSYVTSSQDDALSIIDISNPTNPVEVGYIQDDSQGGTAEVLDYPDEVYVSGNYAYVASYQDDALSVIDISNPTNPVEVGYIQDTESGGTAEALDCARNFFVSGDYVYVSAYADDALSIIDISNPTNPVEVGYIQDDSQGGTAHALRGPDGIYVSDNLPM